MQTITSCPIIKAFFDAHGEDAALRLIRAYCGATSTASDIHDAMSDVLTTREGYEVEVLEGGDGPAVDVVVRRAGAATDVRVRFANTPARVKAIETERFKNEVLEAGVHGVFVGAEIVGRRDMEVDALPGGRVLVYLSRANSEPAAVRDAVVLAQRLGGGRTRAQRATSPSEPIKCEICGKTFKNACGLAHHMRRKHKDVAAVEAAPASESDVAV